MIGPLGSFDLTLGFSYMLLGFAAAVLGGFGSLGGVALGGVAHRVHRTALRWAAPAEAGGAARRRSGQRAQVPVGVPVRADAGGHRDQAARAVREDGAPAVTRREPSPTSTTARPPCRCAGYPYLWLVVFLGGHGRSAVRPAVGQRPDVPLQPVARLHRDGRRLLLRLRPLRAVRVLAGRVRDGGRLHLRVGDPSGRRTSSSPSRSAWPWPRCIAFAFAWVARRANLFFLADRDPRAQRDHQPRSSRQWNQFTGVDGAELH